MTVADQVKLARAASYRLAVFDTGTKNRALTGVAAAIESKSVELLATNAEDCIEAEKSSLSKPLYKRLQLTQAKVQSIVGSLRSVVSLPDPVGTVLLRRELDAGLELSQVRVPIGVVGVIFESRPDALVQISSLAVKSGNAVILKGGSEAARTNRLLCSIIDGALRESEPGFEGAVSLVETREDVQTVLEMDHDIDLMIPRGSSDLVRFIQSNTRIPVLGHADGVCHLYVDQDADPDMAIALTVDAKTQYPAVCNAIETLLVHASQTPLLGRIKDAMPDVELRGCDVTRQHIDIAPATDEDWSTEYNDFILSIRVVDSVEEAIDHINRYGSHHTDVIVTRDETCARMFQSRIDSSSVLWNASTRFADGFRYGLGAEVGISTGKVHARGPVGLEGLTTTQYRVNGTGHVVSDYVSGTKSFTHRDLV